MRLISHHWFIFSVQELMTKKNGGDIDLMIVSPEKWKIDKQIKFEAKLFSLLDEQKIDVVYYQTNEKNTFRSIIEKESVLL